MKELEEFGIALNWDMFKTTREDVRIAIERGYVDGTVLAATCKKFQAEHPDMPEDARQMYLRAMAQALAISLANTVGLGTAGPMLSDTMQVLMVMLESPGHGGVVGSNFGTGELSVSPTPDKKETH